MVIFAGLILAYIPFQGLVEQAGKPSNTPRLGGGKPPVVGLKAKGRRERSGTKGDGWEDELA